MKLSSEKHPDLAARDTVFLHGNLGSHRWWHPTLAAWRDLPPAGGPGALHFVDWRGCGASPDLDPAEPVTIDLLAGDVVEYVERETTGPIDLVGHSLGGLFAARVTSLMPGRVRRLCLLDPVGPRGVVFDDTMYAAFDQMARDPALTGTVLLSTIKNQDRLTTTFRQALVRDANRAVGGAGRAALDVLRTTDLTAALREVRTPTLVLHGAQDQVIPTEDGRAMAAALAEGVFELVEDVGHCWNVEDAASFTRRLRRWLD